MTPGKVPREFGVDVSEEDVEGVAGVVRGAPNMGKVPIGTEILCSETGGGFETSTGKDNGASVDGAACELDTDDAVSVRQQARQRS